MRQNVLCLVNLPEICPEDIPYFKGMFPADIHHTILRAMEDRAQTQLGGQGWQLLTHCDQLPALGEFLVLGATAPTKVLEVAVTWNWNVRQRFSEVLAVMEGWTPTNSPLSAALLNDPEEKIIRLDAISKDGHAGSYDLKLAAAALDNDFNPAQGRAVAGFGDYFLSTLLFTDEVEMIRAHPEQFALVPLVMANF